MLTNGYDAQITSHLMNGLHPESRKNTINKIVKVLKKLIAEGLQFEAIAVRGVSGLILGMPVADKLKKNIIIVRTHKGAHTQEMIEGTKDGRYIIVDDFISTGKTVWVIVNSIKYSFCPEAECVGFINHDAEWLQAGNTQYPHYKLAQVLERPANYYGLALDTHPKAWYAIREQETGLPYGWRGADKADLDYLMDKERLEKKFYDNGV